MSIKGFNISGEVKRYDYPSLDNLPGDTGLSEQAKRALLACFEQVAWIGADGKTYYDALEEALYPQGYVSVTNSLAGCKTTNEATTTAIGKPYNATIVAFNGYTLNGADVMITMGGSSVTGYYSNGTISIPNVTGNLVITVTAASAVSSITAVFTQGDNVIYDTDSLETLRQYLVVTATYSDSTTATVSDYTLSGTLTEGTSTITASYGSKTASFNVTVSSHVVYALPSPTTFDGTSESVIDTGIKLLENDISYSIVYDAIMNVGSNRQCVFSCRDATTGIHSQGYVRTPTSWNQFVISIEAFGSTINRKLASPYTGNKRVRMAFSHAAGESTYKARLFIDGVEATDGNYPGTYNYTTVDANLKLGYFERTDGGVYLDGTINEFVLYDYAMTQAEIDAYVEAN